MGKPQADRPMTTPHGRPDLPVSWSVLSDADLDEIVQLEERCFGSPWSRLALESEIARSRSLAARDSSGRLRGYCFFLTAADEMQILNVAVDPEWRRRGIAGAMMAEILRIAGLGCVHAVYLEVRTSNRAAIGLYRTYGFETTGRRRAYYDDGEDAWVMTRSLADSSIAGERHMD